MELFTAPAGVTGAVTDRPRFANCETCGGSFGVASRGPVGRFCSEACRVRSYQPRALEGQVRTCVICGGAFAPRSFNANVCGEDCRKERQRRFSAAYEKKLAEERRQRRQSRTCQVCRVEFMHCEKNCHACALVKVCSEECRLIKKRQSDAKRRKTEAYRERQRRWYENKWSRGPIVQTCGRCDVEFSVKWKNQRLFCSVECRKAHEWERHWSGKSTLIPWRKCAQCPSHFIARAKRKSRRLCDDCGAKSQVKSSYRRNDLYLPALPGVDLSGPCAYCGGDGKMEPDHVLPVSLGGKAAHRPENIVPACHNCNSAKTRFTLEEWLYRMRDKVERMEKEVLLLRRRIAGAERVAEEKRPIGLAG